jgi:hypothetical protein
MYVMIITFLFYNDPVALGHFSPAVESVLFKSQASCEAARSIYLEKLNPIADELASAIDNEKSVGNLRGPAGVVISAICVAQ